MDGVDAKTNGQLLSGDAPVPDLHEMPDTVLVFDHVPNERRRDALGLCSTSNGLILCGVMKSFLLRSRAIAAVLSLCALGAACGGNDGADSSPAIGVATPLRRPMTPSDSACPRDGLWKPCSLEDRFVKSGLAFKSAGDSVRVPYLTVPGVRYTVGHKATLVVFYYADSAAAARDAAPLDARRLTPPDDSVGGWPSVPTEVVRSANVLAVLFDASATKAERVRLTLTAGAPQPFGKPTSRVSAPIRRLSSGGASATGSPLGIGAS